MKILIACEFSGTVRDAFALRGHDAWSLDLLPTEKPGKHIQTTREEEIFEVIDGGNWDLLLGFPPCTFVNSAGLHWNKRRPERAVKTESAIVFFRRLLESKPKKKALENPIGCLSTRVCKPSQIIQPYQFGENASKSTCLWLIGLPSLRQTDFCKPRMVCKCGGVYSYELAFGKGCPHCGAETGLAKPRWENQTNSGQNKLTPSADRWALRSLTYPGIAKAMAEQWG